MQLGRSLPLLAFIYLSTTALVAADSSPQYPGGTKREVQKNQPILLICDELKNDRDLGLTIARGNVEIVHDGRLLQADVVTYNEESDLVTASGNVRLYDPAGEVSFSNYIELTGDMKEGFVKDLQVILADESLLSARQARRNVTSVSEFEKAVYSPCSVCRSPSSQPPLWQMRAEDVEWVKGNEAEGVNEDIIYRHATMDFFGIPALYAPYFRHPAPGVKRRSGFLTPFFGNSSHNGFTTVIPYYWVIDPTSDLLIEPAYLADAGPVFGAEYRKSFNRGVFEIYGSVTEMKRGAYEKVKKDIQKTKQGLAKAGQNNPDLGLQNIKRVRGHVDLLARVNINSHLQAGLNVLRTSDHTYLKRYTHLGYQKKSFLRSTAYVRGFYGRSYGNIRAYSFQGLNPADRDKTTPLIAPLADVNFLSKPDSFGGRFSVDMNGMNLERRTGGDMQRLSATFGWQKVNTSSWGDVFTFGARVRGDHYHIQNFRPDIAEKHDISRDVQRGIPQLYVDWRMPFVRYGQSTTCILEPIGGLVAAPKMNKNIWIPNEDSRFFELNDSNIFSENRFAGLDRIDGGTRAYLGLHQDLSSGPEKRLDVLLAQSFQLSRRDDVAFDNVFGQRQRITPPPAAGLNPWRRLSKKELKIQDRRQQNAAGLRQGASNYVARLAWRYTSWWSLKSSFLLRESDFKPRRSEILTTVGQPILNVTATFTQLPRLEEDSRDQKGKQIDLALASQFHRNWSVGVGTLRGIGKDKG
ncbi:MAG: LPS-assembly protein LptD [Holosporales bacterium]